MQVVHLGPIALPMTAVLLLLTGALGLTLGRWLARDRRRDAEAVLVRMLVVAVVVARLTFVWTYRAAYFASPLDILDIRDGGWNPQLGAIAAWLYALTLVRREAALRRPIWVAAGAASAVWIAGSAALAMPASSAGLPQVEATALDGSAASLASFAGRPMVLNLWATWCGPCRRELPLLAHAQAANPELAVVLLNQGEAAADVQRYLAASNLALRNVLLDAKGLAGARYGGMLPTTLFFDANGRLAGVRIGALSAATLAQRLGDLAARQSAGS